MIPLWLHGGIDDQDGRFVIIETLFDLCTALAFEL